MFICCSNINTLSGKNILKLKLGQSHSKIQIFVVLPCVHLVELGPQSFPPLFLWLRMRGILFMYDCFKELLKQELSRSSRGCQLY